MLHIVTCDINIHIMDCYIDCTPVNNNIRLYFPFLLRYFILHSQLRLPFYKLHI